MRRQDEGVITSCIGEDKMEGCNNLMYARRQDDRDNNLMFMRSQDEG